MEIAERVTRKIAAFYARFSFHCKREINVALAVTGTLSFITAIAVIIAMTIYVGTDLTPGSASHIRAAIRLGQWIFITNILVRILFDYHRWRRVNSLFKRVVDLTMLSTLLPYVIPGHVVITLLDNRHFLYIVMIVYAVLLICRSVMSLASKKLNPSLMLTGSFMVFIFIGSLLLMMPRCTWGSLSYIDSLFISTSAVCITGLTPVDVAATFTPLGLIILAVLIQIGGLGVLTFTSFFALSFTGNSSIYSQMVMKDMIYSRSWGELIPTLFYILAFTLAIEAVGAVGFMACIHGQLGMSLEEEILTSVFMSLSAFCNAGFSNIEGGMSNGVLMWSNGSVYWLVSVLVVAGSIGFPLLVNCKDMIITKVHDWWVHLRYHHPAGGAIHLIEMNTKIVIVTFGALFLLGVAGFFLLERENTLAGMDGWQQMTQSVFNSIVPRSAGFGSVPVSSMRNVTIVMLIFLMWVGGASQSTGGGIKVNTFATVLLNLRSIIRGRQSVTAFGRSIAVGSLRRANAVVTISIVSYVIFSITILLLEPTLRTRDLLFETASALFTVGSSTGVTTSLGDASLIILSLAMFLGRVGILSLLSGFIGSRNTNTRLPSGNVIIN